MNCKTVTWNQAQILENDARGEPTWRMLMVRSVASGSLSIRPRKCGAANLAAAAAVGPRLKPTSESISSIVSGLLAAAIGTVARRCLSMSNMWTAPASARVDIGRAASDGWR